MPTTKNTSKPVIFNHQLWVQVLSALGLGSLVGFILSDTAGVIPAESALLAAQWLAFPGYLFLALIKMIIIPLVLCSVFCGIANSKDIELVKKLGLRVLLYFTFTTIVSISVGIGLTMLINPGIHFRGLATQTVNVPAVDVATEAVSNWSQALVGFLPGNIFSVLADGALLQVVIFSALFGAAMLALPLAKRKPLIDVAQTVQDGCMVVVGWAMKLVPYAVFGLIAYTVATTGLHALKSMLLYVATILAGLLSMFGVYLLIIKFYVRMPLAYFLSAIRDVQLLAFSTSSSSAVMPVTMETAEKKLGVRAAVSRFVVPTGATINMDGTSMYQAAATIFLAQAFGIDLTLAGYATVLVTALGASIGTPGTPGVGIVILASILTEVGVPVEGIALILGVDRFLDMCRTTLNVTGDLVTTTVMNRNLGLRFQFAT